MKFNASMEYYYNGEKLTPILNSNNEIQYFIKQDLDILPLCVFNNSILSYTHDTKENTYLLKLKSFDSKYRVTIQCQGSTFDNKREDELHSGTKWGFKTLSKGELIVVPYYEIEYLIPYSEK